MQNQKHKHRADEVSQKKAQESIPIQGKECVVLQPRWPQVLSVGSPNF